MPNISSMATTLLKGILEGEAGLAAAIGQSVLRDGEDLAPLEVGQIQVRQVSGEISDRVPGRFPQISVYCDKVTNTQKEKFRAFSGRARMAIEVRVSQERFDGIERVLERYTDAVLEVLEGHRGDWGNGFFYGGGYEVTFQPVRSGGRNYAQSARIVLDVDGSI